MTSLQNQIIKYGKCLLGEVFLSSSPFSLFQPHCLSLLVLFNSAPPCFPSPHPIAWEGNNSRFLRSPAQMWM